MTSNVETYYLLNHLDRPIRLIGIYKDEALALLIPLFIGFFSGWGLSGFIGGVLMVSVLKALKKQNEGVHLIHVFYWYLPTSRKYMKFFLPSYIREYVG